MVVQAARVHGSELAPAVAARMPEGSAGAAAVAPLIAALADALEAAAERMDAADAAHEDELGDDAAPRRLRDESTATLIQSLLDLRRAIDVAYGPEAVAELGFSGSTPREATMVATFATRVLERVPALAARTPRIPGVIVDLEALVAPAATAQDQLRSALGTVATEAREAEQTLVAKQAAIADYDTTFASVANVLEGMFTLAGAQELARRVRPSTRRAGQVAELDGDGVPEVEGEAAPEAGA